MKLYRAFWLNLVWLATVLSPVLAADKPHDFAKWEKAIAAFEAKDRTNSPPTNAILFVGSSTIVLWKNLTNDFPAHRVINRGFGGSEVVDVTHFADRIVFPYQPRAIFFRSGGNDIAAGKTPENVFADFTNFVAVVHARLPKVEIYFLAWNETISRWDKRDKEAVYNRLVKDYAATTPQLHFIPMDGMVLGSDGQPRPELYRSDKLHFSAEGYKLLVERVRPFVNELPADK